jgi:hypothetical protein
MGVLANIGLGMSGFLIGNVAFSRVGHWVVAVHQIAKDQSGEPKSGRIVSATLLSAGPWFLVATGVFGYFVQSQSWAPPILIGALLQSASSAFLHYISLEGRDGGAQMPPNSALLTDAYTSPRRKRSAR